MLAGRWAARPLSRHQRRHAEAWFPDALRMARKLGGGEDEAADALHRAIVTFNGRHMFSGWLFRMVRYEVLNGRGEALAATLVAPDGFDPIDPRDDFAAVDAADAAEVLLAKFGEDNRQLLRLVAFEGLTQAEAAARLGLSPMEVSRRLRLIRERFSHH